MTTIQKQRIERLRGKGETYTSIAAELKISENTVKSYCQRNGLGAGYIAEQTKPVDACGTCGRTLEHTPGSKRKRFCSDECRLLWWKEHPESLSRKAVYNFTCAHCGTEFSAYGNKGRKYCSHACYAADRFGRRATK